MNAGDLCTCGSCAECLWYRNNAELGGDPVPIGEVVDFRHGVANAITILRAQVADENPVIEFSADASGRYRVEFDYHSRAVSLLKAVVPSQMRSWLPESSCWEISPEWLGPLASKFRNAGFPVAGLDETNLAHWFSWCSVAMPTSPDGNRAYTKGMCKVCTAAPHRSGGSECEDCHGQRLTGQHRIIETLVDSGLAEWPEARPAGRGAWRTRAPLELDRDETEVVKHDYTETADAAIIAGRDRSQGKCPICARKPRGSAVVHVSCRNRLLHALSERSFLKSRNAAFQKGLCTVCLNRPHRPSFVTCRNCADLIDVCHQREDKSNGQ